jgi:hypothetical protein
VPKLAIRVAVAGDAGVATVCVGLVGCLLPLLLRRFKLPFLLRSMMALLVCSIVTETAVGTSGVREAESARERVCLRRF